MFKRYYVGLAATAVLYFVAGKLALSLAIPPGYATAIWPGAGIALALILLNGYRFWPGVFVGSILVNLDLSGLWGSSASEIFVTLLLPVVIGFGASLQAVVGAWLFRRFVGYPIALDSIGSVWRFVAFACGLACVVGATVGATALWLAGKLPAENFWFNWFTWWVGDGLGVMIFATLIFVFCAEPREVWRSRQKILSVVLVGATCIIVAIYVAASRWELKRQQADFENRAEQAFQHTQSIINAHLATLYSVQAFFDASTEVTKSDFRAFSQGLLARNAGFQAIAWNERVVGSDRQVLESQLSAERETAVYITRRDQNGELVLQSPKDEYVVIRFIEPLAKNIAALGYDISSAELPRKALLRAEAAGAPAVTDPIRLVQERANQQGVVIYLPVLGHASDKGRVLAGYVSGVFRVDDLMGFLLSPQNLHGVLVSVADASGALLYRGSGDRGSGRASLFEYRKALQVADQQWQFKTEASQSFLVGTRSLVPWGMLVAGLLFTGLLGMSFLVLTGQKYRSDMASKELKIMLSRLQETQDHLVEAEKMASLGGLVAGFAHELNTPLGIAITAESTLQSDLQRLDEMFADADDMQPLLRRLQEASRIVLANIQRAGSLISSFKQVSVDQATAETRDINLHEYLSDVFMHLSPNYRRSGHEVVLECPKSIALRTVPGGLAQVIINLLNNSLTHAFPDGEPGRISLSVTKRESDIVLRFSDNGVGIPAEAVSKVFEPFFTTRRGRGGTGLGLHLVYNIVRQQLQGQIKVSSDLGHGTEFEILLPLAINKFVVS
ncbi:MAG: CHASE domain-containing protein [Zhongshania sp.]|uniref:CHASE domain-containing protein n=1 Tax=Zhongshania sp. TaxID=1971902 RepID=UPI002617A87C|nr:CHASE domain-containing protein [Zhongshania sp.]MDF1694009.1 CHASE domain-containing protein [Zhongshania sp.]